MQSEQNSKNIVPVSRSINNSVNESMSRRKSVTDSGVTAQ